MTPPQHIQARRVALAHDWLVGYRGGEAVLEQIAALPSIRPDLAIEHTGVYTLFARPGALRSAAPHTDALPVHASPLNVIPGARALRRWALPAYPLGVRALQRTLEQHHHAAPIDLLISTSSAAIKGLRAPDHVPHLCYCHSPARYIWDRTKDYGGASALGKLRELGLGVFGPALRRWDRKTAANVTRFLANSTHTAALIREAYGRDAHVVFPPARTTYFTPDPSIERDDFWLVVAALEPYKRTDLAIRAAIEAGARLRVVGDGSQRAELESLAAQAPDDQIAFFGRVDDERLRDLYRRARLLVFPQIEDFGIVAVEAQACGLPVVARAAGGALDSVRDGETGALFNGDTPEAVAEAAARLPERAHDRCVANAASFGEDAFDDALASHIRDQLDAQR